MAYFSFYYKSTRCVLRTLLPHPPVPFRLGFQNLYKPSSQSTIFLSFHCAVSCLYTTMASPMVLPDVPVKHADFIAYVKSHPEIEPSKLLEPYKKYDAKLREVFAQEPNHAALADEHVNIVPVFSGHEKDLKVRARDLESESTEEKERYVMAIDDADRRATGTPAIVESLAEFQQNFSLFCESSLVDLDWNNVVAAGSSVVTSLLPVPENYKKSKKALRKYYHEILAPASDV
jgi:hypothetical protein